MISAAPAGSLATVVRAVEYEVRNRIGTLLYTSPDLDLARTWLRDRAAQWPGAQVNEVTSWKTERRVFKPVAYLRSVK